MAENAGKPIEQLASLLTIGNGAVVEKFEAELRKVLENIRDVNTDPLAPRKILVELVFRPDSDREMVMTKVGAKSVLAATKPTGDVMYVGKQDGKWVGTVVHPEPQDPRQGVLPFSPKKEVTGE